MKTVILSITLACSLSYASAQSKYEHSMQKALESWKKAQSKEQLVHLSNRFERIANSEVEKWQPIYYQGLITTILGFKEKDKGAMKILADRAQVLLNQAASISEKNSHLKTLQAMVWTIYVIFDPASNGAKYSQQISNAYNNAIELDPTNPRPVYLLADYNMHGAKYLGKNPMDYCPDILEAIDLFENENPQKFSPKWGKERALEIKKTKCDVK